jgi:hypothetical protein
VFAAALMYASFSTGNISYAYLYLRKQCGVRIQKNKVIRIFPSRKERPTKGLKGNTIMSFAICNFMAFYSGG